MENRVVIFESGQGQKSEDSSKAMETLYARIGQLKVELDF